MCISENYEAYPSDFPHGNFVCSVKIERSDELSLSLAFEVPVVHESLLKCNVLSWGEAEGAVPGASSRRRPKISSLDKLHFLFPHTHPTGSCRAKIEMDMAPENTIRF